MYAGVVIGALGLAVLPTVIWWYVNYHPLKRVACP